jgi:hypothetical protein
MKREFLFAKDDFLVTGNKRLFLAVWKNTKIVNARELLEAILQREQPSRGKAKDSIPFTRSRLRAGSPHPAPACYGLRESYESSLGSSGHGEALANPDTAVFGRPRPRIHYRQRR